MKAIVTLILPDVNHVMSLKTQPAKVKIGTQNLVFINRVTYTYIDC